MVRLIACEATELEWRKKNGNLPNKIFYLSEK